MDAFAKHLNQCPEEAENEAAMDKVSSICLYCNALFGCTSLSKAHLSILPGKLHAATDTAMRVQLGQLVHQTLELLITRLTATDDKVRPIFLVALALSADGSR